MRSFKSKLEKKLKAKLPHLQFKTIYGKTIECSIETFIAKNNIDLIALSTKQRTILQRVFGKSLTKKLAFHSDTPVLVFHSKK
jgi:nucleotide-binding universal stress UspA family protein